MFTKSDIAIWGAGRMLAALLALVALTACTERRTLEDRQTTLVYGFSENFKTFDSAKQIYAQESAIIQLVLESLVRFDNDLILQPCLATSWETPDDCKTWIFHLREGVRFHDGTPFNAEAVKFHFDRILDPETGATRRKLIEDVTEIEVLDEFTVAFRLNSPNCILPERLSNTFACIVSPTALLDRGAEEFGRRPAGTGPFMVEDWNQATMVIRMKRNPDYWLPDAIKFENLELRQVMENTTRLILLEQGVLDVADISYPHVNVVRESEEITLQTAPQLSIRYIGFNTQNPPFDDVRVRRAANYAINKQDMVEYVFFGVGSPAVGPFPDVLPAYNPEMTVYEYNPEKARQLLAEAGYPNGFECTMWSYESGLYRSTADACVNYLREIGIEVTLKVFDNAVYWNKFDEYLTVKGEQYPTKEGVYDLYVGGWVGGPTAHGYIEPLFQSYSYNNASFYINDQVDGLLAKFKNLPQEEDRNTVYREAQKIIVDEAPWIFAFHGQLNVGVRNHVKNFRVNQSGMYFFDGVELQPAEVEKAL